MTENPRAALRRRRKKRKIVVIAVIAVLTVLAVVSWFFTREKPTEKATPYTADVYDPFTFALIDPDAPSIFEDSAYMNLDRAVHVKRGMEEYTVSGTSAETADGAERLFLDYFDALSHGDAERHGKLFTDEYYQKYLAQDSFTEQRVYDIHLTWLDGADGDERLYYLVEYKIAKNNGSFRRDIGPDSSRPVVFELVRSDAGYRINDVYYVTK